MMADKNRVCARTWSIRLTAKLLLAATLVSSTVWGAGQEVRIGVLAFRGVATAQQMWGPTAAYLSRQIPGMRFTIQPLDLDAIDQAVASRGIDFVLTNTGDYVDLEARHGISRIATLKNLRQGHGYRGAKVVLCMLCEQLTTHL